MRGLRLTLFLVASLLPLVCGAAEATSFVEDLAGVLKADERTKLEDLISAHNKTGPGRIRVLIVKKLPANTTVEEYAANEMNEIPPQAGEKLDRILLLVAMEERRLRIETSRDVWGNLPDKRCNEIIEEEIVPRFKEKKIFEGVEAGLKAMVRELKGK